MSRQSGRRNWLIVGVFVAIIFLIFGGLVTMGTLPTAGGIMVLLGVVAMFVGALGARIIYPVHIDERGARFKGCGEPFLNSLEANRPY